MCKIIYYEVNELRFHLLFLYNHKKKITFFRHFMLYYSYSRIIVGDKMGKLENMLNNTDGIGTNRLTAMVSNGDPTSTKQLLEKTTTEELQDQINSSKNVIQNTVKHIEELLQGSNDSNLQASFQNLKQNLMTMNGNDDSSMLEKLRHLQSEANNLFTNATKSVETRISLEEQRTTTYQQVKEVADLLQQLDSMTDTININDADLTEIASLYKQALDQLGQYNQGFNKQVSNQLLDTINQLKQAQSIATVTVPNINKSVNQNERVFSLFAKITDQIVDAKFVKEDGKIYARYTLEDGSSYYAIIPKEDKVLSEERLFANLANE